MTPDGLHGTRLRVQGRYYVEPEFRFPANAFARRREYRRLAVPFGASSGATSSDEEKAATTQLSRPLSRVVWPGIPPLRLIGSTAPQVNPDQIGRALRFAPAPSWGRPDGHADMHQEFLGRTSAKRGVVKHFRSAPADMPYSSVVPEPRSTYLYRLSPESAGNSRIRESEIRDSRRHASGIPEERAVVR